MGEHGEHGGVDESLRFARCRACGEGFYACGACDRFGERRYCSEGCQRRGRHRVRREARRRESKTPEGRENNLDRQRRFREEHPGRRRRKPGRRRGRAPVATGTDGQVVTDPPLCWAANQGVLRACGPALASTEEATTVVARSTNDESMDSNVGSAARRDASLDDGGSRRADAGGVGSVDVGAPAGGIDAARGTGAVAPAPAFRCSLCRRGGVYLCVAARGRAGFRRTQSALRRRGDALAPRGSTSSAPPSGPGLLW